MTRDSFLATEDVLSDVDDDMALDDEDCHRCTLGLPRGERLAEGSLWLLSRGCPRIAQTSPRSRGRASLQTKLDVARLAKDRRVLDDPQTLVAAAERAEEKDV